MGRPDGRGHRSHGDVRAKGVMPHPRPAAGRSETRIRRRPVARPGAASSRVTAGVTPTYDTTTRIAPPPGGGVATDRDPLGRTRRIGANSDPGDVAAPLRSDPLEGLPDRLAKGTLVRQETDQMRGGAL